MAAKQFDHPLRKFEIEYDELKPWTTLDQNLLDAFIGLHDYEWERKENGHALMKQYAEIDKDVETARAELQKVRKLLDETRVLADVVIPALTINQVVVHEHFDKAVEQTGEAIQEYDKQMRSIDLDSMEPAKNAFFEEQNNMTLWDQFEEVNLEHAQQWEVNSIDTAAFDDTDEKFRSFLSMLEKHNDQVMDFINRAMNNHRILMLETEMLYEIWKEFVKRIQLLEHITGKPRNTDFLNLN